MSDDGTQPRAATDTRASLLLNRLRAVRQAIDELIDPQGDLEVLAQFGRIHLLAAELEAISAWARRVHVIGLVSDGRSHEEVAGVLGVTRQRVGFLLQDAGKRGTEPPRSMLESPGVS